MTISSDAYRDVLRHFPSGVTIVTIRSGEEVHGLTVSAFASVSPDPPLVMIIIDNRHHAYELLQQDEAVFAVNILHQDHHALSDRFAWLQGEDRFAEGEWGVAQTGAPILKDSLGWLDCTLYAHYPAGTHTIFIGHVQASATPRADERPLIYWNREYRQLDGRSEPNEDIMLTMPVKKTG